jgi:hypothetical protein
MEKIALDGISFNVVQEMYLDSSIPMSTVKVRQ